MAQTIYIDSDEEIISVIARLRKTADADLIFVFPKRSLVLQSAINLRLFQREAEKMKKSVRIATQDEGGRRLAERIGIGLAPFGAEYARSGEERPPQPEVPTAVAPRPKREIGSLDFAGNTTVRTDPAQVEMRPTFAPNQQPAVPANVRTAPLPQQSSLPRELRVRNMSPPTSPALNSTQGMGTVGVQQNPMTPMRPVTPIREQQVNQVRPTNVPPMTAPVGQPSAPQFIRNDGARRLPVQAAYQNHPTAPPTHAPVPNMTPAVQTAAASRPTAPSAKIRDEQLRRFFEANGGTSNERQKFSSVEEDKKRPTLKKWLWVVLFGLILVLSGGGALALMLLPKAEVHVVPQVSKRTVDGEFTGRTIAPIGTADDEIIPVRIHEKEIRVTLPFKATGAPQAGGQKARGTVVITNDFAPQSQTLIATTRLEAPDGKIYRLLETVTVPGYTIVSGKREPGAIEVKVVADEPGDAYNISASSFRIPGFKGNPKYDKILGKSTKPMTGGSLAGDSLPTVLKSDIDRALDDARSEAKRLMRGEIDVELMDEEKVLDDTMEVRESGEISLPIVGTAGKEFELSGAFSVRVFALSEKALREKLFARNVQNRDGVEFEPRGAAITYLDVLPKYSEESVVVRVRANLSYAASIDRESLRRTLAGKGESEVKQLLDNSASIYRMSIMFRPEFMMKSFPRDIDRITIIIDEE